MLSTQTTGSHTQIPLNFHTVVAAKRFVNHPDAPRFRHFEKRWGEDIIYNIKFLSISNSNAEKTQVFAVETS